MKSEITKGFSNVDEYLATLTDAGQIAILKRVRAIIKQAAPEATEVISYQMPAYRHHGILIYFAAWKNHWGLYPASSTIKEAFGNELAAYQQTKGAIQFPWNQPLPEKLIERLVNYRMEENSKKAKLKATKI